MDKNIEDPMEALVRQADADRDQALLERDAAIAERDFARKQSSDYANQLKAERENYDKAIRKAKGNIYNIRFPFVLLMAFAGMALLLGLLVKSEMLSVTLGESLIYGCICICAFFGGVVWAKTESRGKNN